MKKGFKMHRLIFITFLLLAVFSCTTDVDLNEPIWGKYISKDRRDFMVKNLDNRINALLLDQKSARKESIYKFPEFVKNDVETFSMLLKDPDVKGLKYTLGQRKDGSVTFILSSDRFDNSQKFAATLKGSNEKVSDSKALEFINRYQENKELIAKDLELRIALNYCFQSREITEAMIIDADLKKLSEVYYIKTRFGIGENNGLHLIHTPFGALNLNTARAEGAEGAEGEGGDYNDSQECPTDCKD